MSTMARAMAIKQHTQSAAAIKRQGWGGRPDGGLVVVSIYPYPYDIASKNTRLSE